MAPFDSTWGTMQDRAPDLYTLLSDRSQTHGKWLPTKLPDGSYGNTPTKVEPSCTSGVSNAWDVYGIMLSMPPHPLAIFAVWFINFFYLFVPL